MHGLQTIRACYTCLTGLTFVADGKFAALGYHVYKLTQQFATTTYSICNILFIGLRTHDALPHYLGVVGDSSR